MRAARTALAGFTAGLALLVSVDRLGPLDRPPCQEDQPCWDWRTMGNRIACDDFEIAGVVICVDGLTGERVS